MPTTFLEKYRDPQLADALQAALVGTDDVGNAKDLFLKEKKEHALQVQEVAQAMKDSFYCFPQGTLYWLADKATGTQRSFDPISDQTYERYYTPSSGVDYLRAQQKSFHDTEQFISKIKEVEDALTFFTDFRKRVTDLDALLDEAEGLRNGDIPVKPSDGPLTGHDYTQNYMLTPTSDQLFVAKIEEAEEVVDAILEDLSNCWGYLDTLPIRSDKKDPDEDDDHDLAAQTILYAGDRVHRYLDVKLQVTPDLAADYSRFSHANARMMYQSYNAKTNFKGLGKIPL